MQFERLVEVERPRRDEDATRESLRGALDAAVRPDGSRQEFPAYDVTVTADQANKLATMDQFTVANESASSLPKGYSVQVGWQVVKNPANEGGRKGYQS